MLSPPEETTEAMALHLMGTNLTETAPARAFRDFSNRLRNSETGGKNTKAVEEALETVKLCEDYILSQGPSEAAWKALDKLYAKLDKALTKQEQKAQAPPKPRAARTSVGPRNPRGARPRTATVSSDLQHAAPEPADPEALRQKERQRNEQVIDQIMRGKRKIQERAQMRAQMKLAKKAEYGKQNHYFLLAQYLTKEELASIDSARYDDEWWAAHCPKELERLVNEGVAEDLKAMEQAEKNKMEKSSKRSKRSKRAKRAKRAKLSRRDSDDDEELGYSGDDDHDDHDEPAAACPSTPEHAPNAMESDEDCELLD